MVARRNGVYGIEKTLQLRSWHMGIATYYEDAGVPWIRWVKGSWFDAKTMSMLSIAEYTDAMGKTIVEWNLNTTTGYESPRRAVLRAEADVNQRKLGKKRVQTKYKSVKNVLERSDAVHMQVPALLRSATSYSCVIGTIYAALPRQQYLLLTHAGIMDHPVPRNDLMLQSTRTQVMLGIPAQMEKLPPLSGREMIRMLNPMQVLNMYCKCKNVRVL